jgi:hypothetical protein
VSKRLERSRRGAINQLRDVESVIGQKYSFEINKHVIYSFDICGSCEAHAILISLQNDPKLNISNALLLRSLSKSQRKSALTLENCPYF